MQKIRKVTVTNRHSGFYMITIEEGVPFPSSWEWLRYLMTDWHYVKSRPFISNPSDDHLRMIFGKDIKIYR